MNNDWSDVIDDIFSAADFRLSDIMPSEWAEQNRFMNSEVSSMEGMYSFDNSPYVREIVDFLHPSNPYRVLVIMKGAQLGLSTGFIENGIGWIINEQPGPTVLLVGHDDLVEKAMKKVDNMLDSTGTRAKGLIRTSANRAKNNKSGDKDRSKDFAGGDLTLGPTNHKTLMQVSYRYGFIDDFDAMKSDSKEDGGTVPLIMQRFSTYAKTMKLSFISTPRVKETSNVYREYLKGDQRKWHVPCPCCGEYIVFEWEIDSEVRNGEKAGMCWELDEQNNVITDSIGYICQKCDGFFTDAKKDDLLRAGDWIATNPNPTNPEYVTYHISSLYGPTYMFGWSKYVVQYMEANPVGQPRIESLHQTFVNLVLGMPYEVTGESNDAGELKKNIRPYAINTIPEKLSIADGNGKIVLLTLGSDMNGTIEDKKLGYYDDARMDWEIVAWSESGSRYSICQGSIGTFVPAHLRTEMYSSPNRVKWTYQKGVNNSVWDELERIAGTMFKTDTGRNMRVMACGIDTAPYTQYSYPFIENTKLLVYGLKGDKQHDTGLFIDADHSPFQISKDNARLYIVNVNRYKDLLATHAKLKWNRVSKQPENFMNFPDPQNGLYSDEGFFAHYEAEHKVIDEKSRRFVWRKKSDKHQNHFYDCHIYNMVTRDLFLADIAKEIKEFKGKKMSWADFVRIVNGSK